MRRRLLTPVLFAFVVACAASAPAPSGPKATSSGAPQAAAAPSGEETVRAIQKAAAASSNAEATVRSLVTEVGARIAGGPKDAAAVAWARRTLEKNGLRAHTEPAKVFHWVRGEESVEIIGDGAQKLHALGLGGGAGTDGKPVEADVVEVASLAALDALDAALVKGKIVFVNAPMRRSRNGAGYGETVAVRFDAPKHAADKGALAIVIRSIGTDTAMPHTGATLRAGGVPGVALSGESADALHDVLVTKKRARIKLALGARWLDPVESANVVGDLKGSERPDEIVLLGAHLDSWDVGQGAVDDGAGCAIVIEAARLVASAGRAPKRTVRVVLFASEELGVGGGDAYAELHAADLGKHVAVMEADSGTAKAYAVRFFGGPGALVTWDAIAARLAPLGIVRVSERATGGADVRPMIAKGVPVVDVEQDFSLYFDVHHTEADTLDRIDPDGLRQAAAAYAIAAWTLADTDADFGRVPPTTTEKK